MPCRSDDGAPPLRVGIVNYLNSRPLAWSFLHGTAGKGFEARFLPPAQVADQLAAGDLDVGLIPSVEVQRIAGLRVLSGLCVAATREAKSVLLLTRRPPHRIRRLALDENSRTSAVLVRIVLRERYGTDPECISASPELEAMMRQADAALLIGDPALRVDRGGYGVLDLADEWRRLTGRPFVFALWAVRAGVELGTRAAEFRRSLQCGLGALDELARRAAEELDLELAEVRQYLTDNLSYDLGDAELAGLGEFHHRAHLHGLIPRSQPLRFVDPCDGSAESVE